MPTEHDLTERDIRQRDIVPPAKLSRCRAIVVGVGAIGRQVALQLAALGVPELVLFDHDRVAMENLAAQGYWPTDLGEHKTVATSRLCHAINPACNLEATPERFGRSSARQLSQSPGRLLVLFCCVDSMSARRIVWESMQHRVELFVDGRMNAEVIRVLAAAAPSGDAYYPTTLFSEHEAFGGSCTARSTIYTASVAAGLMLGQFTRWLRDIPVERDLMLNLLSTELTVDPAGGVRT